MTQNKHTETGRTLLETLAILVIIAILLLASILGYNLLIHHYRRYQTVKQVSELAVRYKLRPVADKGYVDIKTIYPEAERASSVEMKTADTESGRVKLQVFSEPTSFAVVVNHVLDDSCESILENGDYDVVIKGDDIDINEAESENAYSKEYIKSLGKKEKTELIEKICTLKNMGLVFGDHCPRTGASYWYRGRCWSCPSNQTEDKFGNCCASSAINDCGICNDKADDCKQKGCPGPGKTVCDGNGTKACVECVNDSNCSCRAKSSGGDGKEYCVNYKCVECKTPGDECKTADSQLGFCTKFHTCEPCDTSSGYFRWNKNLDVCECNPPLIAIGSACPDACCVNGAGCYDIGAGQKVCAECLYDYDGEHKTPEYCRSERPVCNNYRCEGCAAKPTAPGATCDILCGCDETKGLACEDSKTCQCTAWPGKTFWHATEKKCVECLGNYGSGEGECSTAEKPLCDATTHTCKVCPSETPFWDNTKKQCIGCRTTEDCTGKLVCDPTEKICINGCEVNGDVVLNNEEVGTCGKCVEGEVIQNANISVDSCHTCTSSWTLSWKTDGEIPAPYKHCGTECCPNGCNLTEPTQCAECDENKDCEGERVCNTATKTCCQTGEQYCGTKCCARGCNPAGTDCAECNEDTDCEGERVCNKTTKTCCPTGEQYCGTQCCPNGCNPTDPTQCAECDDDSDCAGRTDGKTKCDTTTKTCINGCETISGSFDTGAMTLPASSLKKAETLGPYECDYKLYITWFSVDDFFCIQGEKACAEKDEKIANLGLRSHWHTYSSGYSSTVAGDSGVKIKKDKDLFVYTLPKGRTITFYDINKAVALGGGTNARLAVSYTLIPITEGTVTEDCGTDWVVKEDSCAGLVCSSSYTKKLWASKDASGNNYRVCCEEDAAYKLIDSTENVDFSGWYGSSSRNRVQKGCCPANRYLKYINTATGKVEQERCCPVGQAVTEQGCCLESKIIVNGTKRTCSS